MGSFLRIFCILLISQSLSACVDMRNQSETGVTLTEAFRKLSVGTWFSSCISNGGGSYSKYQLIFEDNSFVYTAYQNQYTESTCSVALNLVLTTHSQLSYQILSSSADGYQGVVAAAINAGDTTYFNAGVAAANAAHACTYSSWAAGVTQSWFLPGQDCRATFGFPVQPTQGMIHYTRNSFDFSVNPPTLRLGNDPFPNTSLASISSSYQTIIYYKQP